MERYEFQAETKQLLDLMVNSIYTNKEIFLRELISNASDALDKLHFAALTDTALTADDPTLRIELETDKEAQTLTIRDNGIGMTADEVRENIGTIAKSGTKAFMENLKKAQAAKAEAEKAASGDGEASAEAEGGAKADETDSLIGQFGVGFYSAFMVAEKVDILTRKAGTDAATHWQSAGDGSYSLEPAVKLTRGTEITLTLKPEFYEDGAELNLLDQYRLEGLVKQYSNYVRYPVQMDFETEETPKDADGKPIPDAKPVKTVETRTLNSQQPLWKRSKSQLKAEDYNEFYKSQFHAWVDPLAYYHTSAEGRVEYTALLYIPGEAPVNLYYADYEPGLQLYSRSVFIMDKCKELLPDYLKFVQGLVDSPDFSLNISRELLQQSAELKLIGKNLEKNILKNLANMLANDREKYEKFWAQYGRSLKLGVYGSMYGAEEEIKKLQDLLLFTSSKDGKLYTLQEFAAHMPEGQQKFYYATGKSREAVNALPQMEALTERGYEVLCLTDDIDEFALEVLHAYDGKDFQSLTRGELDLGETDADKDAAEAKKKAQEELAKTNEELLKDVKEALGDTVFEVKLNANLKSSPVALTASAMGPSLEMEQVLARGGQNFFKAQRILELNPEHALFAKLIEAHAAGKDAPEFKENCELLYGQALLVAGLPLENPAAFAAAVAKVMAR